MIGRKVTHMVRMRFMTRRGLVMIAGLVCVSCSAPDGPKQAAAPTPANTEPVKILNFYPRDPVVTEGGETVLCYGVSNAKSVRIEPAVAGVWPALSRCVEVHPKAATRYTLTAVGDDGRIATQAVNVEVGADTSALPKISSFQVESARKDYAGKTVFTLGFSAQNAVEISIDPPVFPPLHGAPSGQFGVSPDKTTTYTLTVKGKSGHVVHQKLVVQVPEGK